MKATGLERAVRLLLRLYPASFRSVFGEDLVATFVSEAGMRRGRVRRWLHVLHGMGVMVAHGLSDRFGEWRSARWAAESRPSRGDGALVVVRSAVRRLVRMPGLSAGVVLLFALGIGANASMYGGVERLLLRPPAHLRDAESLRIVALDLYSRQMGKRIHSAIHSYPDLTDWESARSLSGVAGYNYAVRELTVGRGDAAERLSALPVTGRYFEVLGATPILGRALGPADEVPGAEPVVVISEGLWRRSYGGARAVLSETIEIDDVPHRIVGVMPRGFTGAEAASIDLWQPMAPWRRRIQGPDWYTYRMNHWLAVVARLAPGVPEETAEAELTALSRAAAAETRDSLPSDARVRAFSLIPGRSPLGGAEVDVARWLSAVSLIVLLVACINVANLFLARAARSGRELAIQRALGVTRRRLAAQAAVETMLLAGAGGAAALAIARFGSGALLGALMPTSMAGRMLSDTGNAGLSLSQVGATLGLTAVAALLATLVPVVWTGRAWARSSLATTSGGIARSNASVRAGLVVAQVALSAVLLAGAGLFVRSFGKAARADLGIELDRGWYLTVENDELPDMDAFYRNAVRVLSSTPGVAAAGASSTYPFFQRHGTSFGLEGMDTVTEPALVHVVRGDYFRALGLDVVTGRAIGEGDVRGTEPVAVVNRELQSIWRGPALGRCLYVGEAPGRCARVVGVVENAIVDGIGGRPVPQFYLAASQFRGVAQLWGFPIRLAPGAEPGTVLASAREALYGLAPQVRWVEATPFASMLSAQVRPWRLGATLFSLFGGLALLVAGIGLFGVVAFDVAQRMRELGLRASLGATPASLLGLVVRRSFALAGAGSGIGVAVSLVLAPRLGPLLFEVAPRDPITLVAVVLVLGVVACVSAALPAARAARADPNTALRTDG
ncbi:MAG: ABC transporter permease [Gemmatimonadota bacterium]